MKGNAPVKTNEQSSEVRFRGIAGFVAAAVSAATSTAAILAWRYNVDHLSADMSGGVAFSMNVGPLVWTLVGISIAFIALLLTGISVWTKIGSKRVSLTVFHVGSLILLLPSAFLIVKYLSH